MVKQTFRSLGNLECVAIHDHSGSVLTIDAPKDNQGKGEHFSPTDLVLTGLASCLLITAGIRAQAFNVSLEGSSATGVKTMTAEPPRRIERLEVELALTGTDDEATRREIELAISSCPVSRSIHPAVQALVTVKWV